MHFQNVLSYAIIKVQSLWIKIVRFLTIISLRNELPEQKWHLIGNFSFHTKMANFLLQRKLIYAQVFTVPSHNEKYHQTISTIFSWIRIKICIDDTFTSITKARKPLVHGVLPTHLSSDDPGERKPGQRALPSRCTTSYSTTDLKCTLRICSTYRHAQQARSIYTQKHLRK